MHELQIDDFGGRSVASSADELQSVLARRYSGDANSFWFSPVGAEYPCLAVLITGELAVVHWFPTEGDAGHQSLSNDDAIDNVRFVENNDGAEMWLPRSAAVDAVVAMRCVEQFAGDLVRPSAINWIEL